MMLNIRVLMGALSALALAVPMCYAQSIANTSYPIPRCFGSATQPPTNNCLFLPRESAYDTESAYRKSAGENEWKNIHLNGGFGLALSGGGSKSSPFAMGVLSGLHDAGYLSFASRSSGNGPYAPNLSIISSVSGGGYTAYWYFSQIARRAEAKTFDSNDGEKLLSAMFDDCLTFDEEEDNQIVMPSNRRIRFFFSNLNRQLAPFRCVSRTRYAKSAEKNLREGVAFRPSNKYQHLLRCGQDILNPGICAPFASTEDALSSGFSTASLVLPSIISAPAHHFANTLFDWGVNLSPSRSVYRNGMGLTYGSTPTESYSVRIPKPPQVLDRQAFDCPLAIDTPPSGEVASTHVSDVNSLSGCYRGPDGNLRPEGLSFQRLRGLWTDGQSTGNPSIPFWVIQATAAQRRGLTGLLALTERNVPNDTFEFTPLGLGSRTYGFVRGSLTDFDVLDATTASAAFLDAAQSSLGGFGVRQLVNSAQYIFNANWGIDIPNYNVGEVRLKYHTLVPFPLNLVDSLVARVTSASIEEYERTNSVWMRILDGGNADNTGLYSLLRRGVRVAVLADGAHDARVFDDLCTLQMQLQRHATEVALGNGIELKKLYLAIPGLESFDEHCASFKEKKFGLFILG